MPYYMLFFWLTSCLADFSILDIIQTINNDYDALLTTKKQNDIDVTNFERKKTHTIVGVTENLLVAQVSRHSLMLKRVTLETKAKDDTEEEKNSEAKIDTSDEVQLTALNHPNIVTAFIQFKQRYKNNIVYQWTVKEKLHSDLFVETYRDDLRRQNEIAMDLCKAIAYLKSQNVVHLNINLGNIGFACKDKKICRAGIKQLRDWYKELDNLIKDKQGYIHAMTDTELALNRKIIADYDNIYAKLMENRIYDLRKNEKYIYSSSACQASKNKTHAQIEPQTKIDTKNGQMCTQTMQQTNKPLHATDFYITFKLRSFELARTYSNTSGNNKLDTSLYGTFPHFAPEVVDQKCYYFYTDTFYFGTTYYELRQKQTFLASKYRFEVTKHADLRIADNANYIISAKDPIDKLIASCIGLTGGRKILEKALVELEELVKVEQKRKKAKLAEDRQVMTE